MNKELSLVLVSILLMSCALLPTPGPAAEPTTTKTIEPTKTSPTSTAIPTEALTVPDLSAFSTVAVAEGFTISVPFPLLHQVDKNVVIIGNEENTLTISFASDSLESGETLEDVMNAYLASLEERGWEFTKSESVDFDIDHATGILVDLTGTAQNLNFEGQAVTVSPHPGFVLFGLGLFEVSTDPEGWKNTGERTFKTLMDGIRFIEVSGVCPISADETYGYSEENPIRVGGDFTSGVSRERAYLNHLRGPSGETLSYERQGSLQSGDTILDIYNITGPGVDEILYVDLYNYSGLFAPLGFTCEGAFPLSAP